MSVEAVGDGSGLAPEAKGILNDLAAWWADLPPEGLPRGWLTRRLDPPYEPGEHLVTATSPYRVRRIARGASSAEVRQERDIPGPELPSTLAALHATNVRARLVAARGRVLFEWRWSDCSSVVVGPGWESIRFERADDVPGSCTAAVWHDNHAVLGRRGLPVAEKMLQVEALWAVAHGQPFDRWLAGLALRLTASPA